MIKELMRKLEEPFQEDELEFRVGATNTEKTKGLALAYVQARAIQKRLDEVVGADNWRVSYKEINNGFIAKLELRINNEWIAKEDGAGVTDYEAIKGGISCAFKRVASVWGIGRYLYQFESKWFDIIPKGKSYVFKEKPILNKKVSDNKSNSEENSNVIVIEFGKYKGKSLSEIAKTDFNYLTYLAKNSKDENIINGCKRILREREVG